MSNLQKNGKRAMNIAIYVLMTAWVVLLVLLIAIYVLRLQGYDNFTEWMNRNNTQETITPSVVTPIPTTSPEPTEAAVPTEAPESMVTITPTVAPEPTSTIRPTIIPAAFSGEVLIDADIREQLQKFADGEETLPYESYVVGNYFSIVFKKAGLWEDTETEYLLPLVYDLKTKEQVTGSEFIKETYFAVTKERLQSIVAEMFPEESEFVSYDQIYRTEDYEQFYLTEEQLVFYFDENSLTENGHQPFTYTAELSEARAFFRYCLDGSVNGPVIRELDPDAKMIALTFDDGPHPKVENNLLKLLDEYDVKVTFFSLGHRIEWYPEMTEKIYEAGHEVASHTYSHELNFATVTSEEMWSEINRTNLLIANTTGYAPDYVRFPGGTPGKKTKNIPMLAINWNIDSIDYQEKNKEDGARIIFERLKKAEYLGDGGIVLLHSIYENSYEAVKMFIPYLQEQGYVLVTLSELFYYKGTTLEEGVVYYDGFGATTRKRPE